MGLITTVSPYRGSLSPQPTYYPTPQHTYQHTYKLAYHNSITSFSISNLFIYRNYHAQTALHELVDNHVFLTSTRCRWHSNPNFWGEMEWKRFVFCALLVPECQAFEGSLASMLYWSNVLFLLDTLKPCYLQTLSIIKASAKSPVLQVALVAKQALFCKSPCWRSKPSQDVNHHHANHGMTRFSVSSRFSDRGRKGAPLFSVSIGRPRPMMMPLFSVSSRFSDRGRKGAPLFSVSIGRPRPMMMPLFSVSSRFSDRGRKGAPLFSVSIGRPRPMMMPLFSVSSRFSDRGRALHSFQSQSGGRGRWWCRSSQSPRGSPTEGGRALHSSQSQSGGRGRWWCRPSQSPCRSSPLPWRCCSSRTMQGWGKRIHQIWAPWQCRHPWAKKRPWVAWGKTRKNATEEHKDAEEWHKIPSANWKS